jgi:hypothetical protein
VVYPLVVHLEHYDSIYQVGTDGNVPPFAPFPYSAKSKREYDLFMETKKRTVFVNIYEGRPEAGVFDSKEQAEANAKNNNCPVVATAVPVEIEE